MRRRHRSVQSPRGFRLAPGATRRQLDEACASRALRPNHLRRKDGTVCDHRWHHHIQAAPVLAVGIRPLADNVGHGTRRHP